MAHLVRVQQVRYVDGDGRRVPKGTKGAKKLSETAKKWYGAGIPGMGKKRVPLAADKEAARRMLADLAKSAERGEAKMLDRAACSRPLLDHLSDFQKELVLGIQSATGRKRRSAPSGGQVRQVVQRIRDVLSDCPFRRVEDLKGHGAAEKLSRYLRDRAAGQFEGRRKISAQTANFYLFEARRFTKWIARRGTGVPADIFDTIAGFDPQNNRKHPRRELAADELTKLLAAARASEDVYYTLAGEDRYHLYLTAFATGFRASELAALTPAHFDLAGDPPAVALSGKATKNKRAARQPLPPAVAIALRSYLADRPANRPIWSGGWNIRRAARMLGRDLAAAGVPYVVEGPHGKEYADFHALRHTYVSALAATGTGAKELQTLARHQDPRMTLGIYTHTRSAELARAVGRLQIPGAGPASPFAGLDRDELERLALGLVVMLGTLLTPAVAAPVAPRVALGARTDGNSRGLLHTERNSRLKLTKPRR